MWSWCRLVVLSVFIITHSAAADPQSPWQDEWTMVLKGTERWFVDYEGKSFLQVEESDLDDLSFLTDKDVMIQTKFQQLKANTAEFYTFPTLEIGVDSEIWSTFIDGDNIYVLGKVKEVDGNKITFKTRHVLRAPSDSSIIATKLAAIPETDLDKRIEFAQWVRKNGNKMGNRAVWISAADNIVDDCINKLADQAKEKKDVELIIKAMNWSIDELSDKSRAAKLGSQDWINKLDVSKSKLVIDRMGILGLVRYEGKWVTKREEKILSFEKSLRSINQNDDKAFLALAEDIARYRDVLPEALELKHKALQTGLRHNPNSNILRTALGKKTVEEEQAEQTISADYVDEQSGLTIPVPEGWQRSKEAIEGDVTWIDPNSDTAYISLTVVRGGTIDTFLPSYNKQLDLIKAKQGYAEVSASSLGVGSASRETNFNFMEGREQRDGIIAGVLLIQADTTYIVYCSYIPDESVSVKAAYKHILSAFDKIKAEAVEIPAPKQKKNVDNGAETAGPEKKAPETVLEEGDGYKEGDPR